MVCNAGRRDDQMSEFHSSCEQNSFRLQLKVAVGCVNGSSYEDCMAKIKAREADLVTLDAEHLYAAGTLIHTM